MKKNGKFLRLVLITSVLASQVLGATNAIADSSSANSEPAIETLENGQESTVESEEIVVGEQENNQLEEVQEVPNEPVQEEQVISVVAEPEEVIVSEIKEEPSAEESKMVDKQTRGLEITIDASNFPDTNLKNYVSTNLDLDNNGKLSTTELSAVTSLNLNGVGISNIKGLELFPNLKILNVSNNSLSTLDVSNLKNLETLDISKNHMTALNATGLLQLTHVEMLGNDPSMTLDFRGSLNLKSAYHSKADEIVYISAGMTQFIGCHLVASHTGNIVIDLEGFFTINPDGSKSVDLSTVISPQLLAQFNIYTQPGFDPNTNILTIGKDVVKTEYNAGKKGNGTPFNWTFHTKAGQVGSFVVNYDSKGGSVVPAENVTKDNKATKPADPTLDGYNFLGWFVDDGYTTPVDFTTGITTDVTYYAKWEKKTEKSFIVNFESNGGTSVAPQIVIENGYAVEVSKPVREGYTFLGWYHDKNFQTAVDFKEKITKDNTYFAKWARNYKVNFDSNGGTTIASQDILEGDISTEPKNPTKDGFEFAGWYLDEGLENRWDFKTVVSSYLKSSETTLTLYAKWAPIKKGNGGSIIPPKNDNSGNRGLLPKTGELLSDSYAFIGSLWMILLVAFNSWYKKKTKSEL